MLFTGLECTGCHKHNTYRVANNPKWGIPVSTLWKCKDCGKVFYVPINESDTAKREEATLSSNDLDPLGVEK